MLESGAPLRLALLSASRGGSAHRLLLALCADSLPPSEAAQARTGACF